MIFEHITPAPELNKLIKEIWVYENEDSTLETQKIIPDGFSEIIIHYGDSYKIRLDDHWERQSSMLFSSQISKFFFLKNTGKSGMIGIKLHPATFYELFKKDLSKFTDQVVPLENILPEEIKSLKEVQNPNLSIEERVNLTQQWISSQVKNHDTSIVRNVIDEILSSKGLIDIEQLGTNAQLSTRQLERTFKKVVGLTPKFYSRIIRFNYIFEVMKEQNNSWIKTALQSGYFDQSHFIKNFKEFTGEEPSQYGFDEINLANFFLKK